MKKYTIRKKSGKPHIFTTDLDEYDVATSLCGIVDRIETDEIEGFNSISLPDLKDLLSQDSNHTVCANCKRLV